MGELGSIFGDQTDGDRGPDLKFEVEVPEGTLGSDAGYAAPVPEELAFEGTLVPRVRGPGDPRGKIILRLPEGFASGATLRLRGQGGCDGGKPAGDLFLRIALVPGPAPSEQSGVPVAWIVLAVLAAGGLVLYAAL